MYYVRDLDTYQQYAIVRGVYYKFDIHGRNGVEVNETCLLLPCMQHMQEVSAISVLYNKSGETEVAIYNKSDMQICKSKVSVATAKRFMSLCMLHETCITTLERQVNSDIQQYIFLYNDVQKVYNMLIDEGLI